MPAPPRFHVTARGCKFRGAGGGVNPAKVILENGLGGRKILYVCVTEKGFLSMRRQSEGFVAVLRPGVNRPVDVDVDFTGSIHRHFLEGRFGGSRAAQVGDAALVGHALAWIASG